MLTGYSGIVQCDGYAVYKQLADPGRDRGAVVTLAFCWSHWRRHFFDIDKGGRAPIAHEALERIAALYAIESRIHGRSAEERRAVRQAETKPLVEKLRAWLKIRLAAVSEKSTIAEAIRYGFHHWDGLVRFLDDGRIEMDTNSVERAMRPIALNRKNSLFAGHDDGAVNWACLASLIETAKLHGIDPQAYLADILGKLVNGWPVQKLDQLLPWLGLSRPEFASQLDHRSYSDQPRMRVAVWSRHRLLTNRFRAQCSRRDRTWRHRPSECGRCASAGAAGSAN